MVAMILRIVVTAIAIIVLAIAALWAATALAHSWYPPDCCAGKDCKPIACNALTIEGRIIVYREQEQLYFADVRNTRISPDELCHICIWPGTKTIRCLFTPQNIM